MPTELQPHIRLSSELDVRCAILPGDPARINRILPFLNDARGLAFNREFRSAVGSYEGMPVIALSTGIGGASMAIAVEELHNIGVTHLIRIGSAGALQHGIALGDLIFSNGAVRDDGASAAYADIDFPAIPDTALLMACIEAARERGYRFHVGITRSHDSFYTDREDDICRKWSRLGVLGADMETAALFTVGAYRGMKTASILNNVVLFEEDAASGITDYVDGKSLTAKGEQAEILTALDALKRIVNR